MRETWYAYAEICKTSNLSKALETRDRLAVPVAGFLGLSISIHFVAIYS